MAALCAAISLASCASRTESNVAGASAGAVVNDSKCGDLTKVRNPSFAEFDAQWERFARLDWEAITAPDTNGGRSDGADHFPFSRYLNSKNGIRTDPAWREIVDSIPAGGLGRFRQLVCQDFARALDTTPSNPAEAMGMAASKRVVQLLVDEPFFALYAFGPLTCLDIPHDDDDAGQREQRSLLCPVKRLPPGSNPTGTPR
jgi:hypothetical protein